MTNPLQRAISASVIFGAMTLVGGAQGASAQTTCDMACLGQLVTTCADDNSSVANWWEFGNGFQTCVASRAPGQCGAAFTVFQPPQGETVVIGFRPLESESNCLIPTSTRQ